MNSIPGVCRVRPARIQITVFYNSSPRIGPALPRSQASCLSFQGWGDLEDPEGEERLLWLKFPIEANKRRYCPAMGPRSPWLDPNLRER